LHWEGGVDCSFNILFITPVDPECFQHCAAMYTP
jgi:hypothetical protein